MLQILYINDWSWDAFSINFELYSYYKFNSGCHANINGIVFKINHECGMRKEKNGIWKLL